MTDKIKNKIIDLYFEEMYSIEDIRRYFKDDYTEPQIWDVINEYYKNYKKR